MRRREGNIIAMGKNITWKRGRGKQYHLPYIVESVGKNIKWGRGDWDGNFGDENQVVGNFIYPC